MIHGIGIDVVDIARFESALACAPKLRGRLFTPAEQRVVEAAPLAPGHFESPKLRFGLSASLETTALNPQQVVEAAPMALGLETTALNPQQVVEAAPLAPGHFESPELRFGLSASLETTTLSSPTRASESLAARFAAKEAVIKAIGAVPGFRFTDFSTTTAPDGLPVLSLSGATAARAAALGITRWHVSLSHDGGVAMALVIAESRECPCPVP